MCRHFTRDDRLLLFEQGVEIGFRAGVVTQLRGIQTTEAGDGTVRSIESYLRDRRINSGVEGLLPITHQQGQQP